jgi:hypothetical protein
MEWMMLDLLAQGTGEVVGIAAVAGVAIGGAFKLASVVIAKKANGNGATVVRAVDLPCSAHAERMATIEASSIAAKEKLDGVAADVKEILWRMPNTKGN